METISTLIKSDFKNNFNNMISKKKYASTSAMNSPRSSIKNIS
jgi:hypothetical protein